MTMEALLNGLLAQTLLHPQPNATSRIGDLLKCCACYDVQVEHRVRTALSFEILQSKLKERKLDEEVLRVLRGVAPEMQPCPFFSYIHVSLLTQIFVRYGLEDPWRCLDELFVDRSPERERHETSQRHMNIRKRKITRLLPPSNPQSLHSFQTRLNSAFPKETTFKLMHDYIKFQKPSLRDDLEKVYQSSLMTLSSEKLSVKSWAALGVTCPSETPTALMTLEEARKGTPLRQSHLLEAPPRATGAQGSHQGAMDHDPDLIDPDFDSDGGSNAPLHASPVEIQYLNDVNDVFDRFKKGQPFSVPPGNHSALMHRVMQSSSLQRHRRCEID